MALGSEIIFVINYTSQNTEEGIKVAKTRLIKSLETFSKRRMDDLNIVQINLHQALNDSLKQKPNEELETLKVFFFFTYFLVGSK